MRGQALWNDLYLEMPVQKEGIQLFHTLFWIQTLMGPISLLDYELSSFNFEQLDWRSLQLFHIILYVWYNNIWIILYFIYSCFYVCEWSLSFYQILSHREPYTESENLLCNFKPSSLIDYNRFKSKIKGPYRNPLVLIGETSSAYKTRCSPKSDIEGSTLEVKYQCLFFRCCMATLMLMMERTKIWKWLVWDVGDRFGHFCHKHPKPT